MKNRILENFRTNPRGLLNSMGIDSLKFQSREAIGLCPLHQDSRPSFSINLESGLWKCFAGCGAGDLFTLYKELHCHNGSFFELLKEMEQL